MGQSDALLGGAGLRESRNWRVSFISRPLCQDRTQCSHARAHSLWLCRRRRDVLAFGIAFILRAKARVSAKPLLMLACFNSLQKRLLGTGLLRHVVIKGIVKVADAAFLIAGEGNAGLSGCAKAFLDAHQIVGVLIGHHGG